MLKKSAKILWRSSAHLTVAVLVLLFSLWLTLVFLAASASGSRWLLEKIVQSQKLVRFEVVSGSLRDGLSLRNFRFTGKIFYLNAETLELKLTWAGLLRGDVFIDRLRGDKVGLVFIGPPNLKPTKLKYVNLPFRLILADGELTHAWIDKRGFMVPINRLGLQADWQHTQLDIHTLTFEHPKFSTQLSGLLHFKDNYPLQAKGLLQANFWQQKQLKALSTSLSGDFTALNLHLVAAKGFPVALETTVNVLSPQLAYQGSLRWGKVQSPWLTAQEFSSKHGQVIVRGNKKGLVLSLVTDLKGKLYPQGEYRAYAETDWHSIHLLPLEARTLLGGLIRAEGRVAWQKNISWDIASQWLNVVPSRQWPRTAPYLPLLTGQLLSKGAASRLGSDLTFKANWLNKETWQGHLVSKAWPWQFDEGQKLDAEWQNINRSLQGIGLVQSHNGKVSFNGTPQRYNLNLNTRATTAKTPEGLWQITGQGNKQHFNFANLDYQGMAGHLHADGQFSWPQGLTWHANVTVDDFKTASWLANWPAHLTGKTQSSGVWRSNQHQLNFTQTALQGELKSLPLHVSGDLSLDLTNADQLPYFQAHRFVVDWDKNHLAVEGGFNNKWDVTIDSQLNDLSALDARLKGQLSGVVVVQGDKKTPALTLNLAGESLQFQQVAVSSLSVSGTLPELGAGAGFLQVSAKNLMAANRVLPNFGLVMVGSRADHQITWQMAADPVEAEGVLHGALDNNFNWQGESQAGTVNVGDFSWQLTAPFAVNWQQLEKHITLAPHCWLAEQAQLCSQDNLEASPQVAHAHFDLSQLEISRLSAVFPEGLAWQGALQGNVEMNWRVNHPPELKLELITDNGAIGLSRDDDEPLTLPYHQLRLAANTEADNQIKFRFDMQAPNMGQGYIEARIKPDEKPYTINGAMLLEKVNLAILKPFLPGMQHLVGEINLSGGLSGPITQPDFYGEFSLTGGEAQAKNTPINLTNTEITASIRGKEAAITGQLNSGEGLAKLGGKIDWSGDEPVMNLHVTGDKLEFKQKPLFKAKVSPDLNVQVKPYYVDIKGKATVEDAVLRPQTLSDKAVALSPDVRVIDLNATDRLKIAKVMRQWDVNADIDLLLADNVLFQGFGLNSKLTGNIRLQQQKQRGMQAIGEIKLDKEAKYEAYGQNLQIRRGNLLFAGSIAQPAVDIEAVKEIDGKVVGVRVEGRANAPTLTLFADTAMTQDEMLGYLLLGRPLYQEGQLNLGGGGNDSALLASAALSFGIKGGQGLAGDIGNAIGVKNVTLDAEGSGDNTRFTVSGYLSPRLYLRYGVGVFTPVNKVTLRYKLNQNLYLEAVSSLESALDLFYNFKF